MKRELNPKMLYFGTPVILVSSLNADGTTNIAPMSSVWWVGQTAMLGLSAQSQTVRNLEQRPACVLNLVDGGMVDAIDRIALLTGRPDVPGYKQARGYTYEPDKFAAAGLSAEHRGDGLPAAVAESPVQLAGEVRAIHEIDGPDSGLRALEVAVLRTHVDDGLLMTGHPNYIDPLRWDPLLMKFTEYFSGAELSRPSSLARGWDMPELATEGPATASTAKAGPATGGTDKAGTAKAGAAAAAIPA
ncbi:MAG TPA: flavin reductase family protein [Streptosporangiaceae bacterium]